MSALTLDQVLSLQEVGAHVLDTRDPAEFAASHLKGSINVGLGGQYATWAGTVLTREHPIVIIAAAYDAVIAPIVFPLVRRAARRDDGAHAGWRFR